MSISSKNEGKSSGARIIYFIINQENEIYLICIFDKTELENISKDTILQLLKNTGLL